jgi:hypothetical protein
MPRRTYTDAERHDALRLYETDGPRAVEDQLGIPASTVVDWAKAAGIRTRSVATKTDAIQASMLTLAERKAQLASAILDDVEKLRQQLFASTVERKPMVVSDGQHAGSHVEIVDVDLDQPTFTDQKAIMTSIAIGVDKVLLLSGEATSRVEVRTFDDLDRELEQLLADGRAERGVDA